MTDCHFVYTRNYFRVRINAYLNNLLTQAELVIN